MEHGVTFQKMPPGELIYLNLPLHPGSTSLQGPAHRPVPGALARRRKHGISRR